MSRYANAGAVQLATGHAPPSPHPVEHANPLAPLSLPAHVRCKEKMLRNFVSISYSQSRIEFVCWFCFFFYLAPRTSDRWAEGENGRRPHWIQCRPIRDVRFVCLESTELWKSNSIRIQTESRNEIDTKGKMAAFDRRCWPSGINGIKARFEHWAKDTSRPCRIGGDRRRATCRSRDRTNQRSPSTLNSIPNSSRPEKNWVRLAVPAR